MESLGMSSTSALALCESILIGGKSPALTEKKSVFMDRGGRDVRPHIHPQKEKKKKKLSSGER